MISDAQERNCFVTDYTMDSHPDSVKKRAEIYEATLQKNTHARRIESLRFIGEGRRHWESVRNMSAPPRAQPFTGYRIRGRHTTRPIGNREIASTADAFDDVKRAEAASMATAEAEADYRRRHYQALQASHAPLDPISVPRLFTKDTSEEAPTGMEMEEDQGDDCISVDSN